MLIGVDKRVGFRHAIYDEEYAFSHSGLKGKHRTPKDLVTRAIDKIFEKSLRFCVKHSPQGKVRCLFFSNSC